MFSIWQLLRLPYAYHKYIWIDVLLMQETRKAILIEFDGQKTWLPKAWVVAFRRSKVVKQYQSLEAISIKISLYHWAKKFS